MFLFCHFLHSNVPENKCCKQKWPVLFFICIRLVVVVLACACAIACIKLIRLSKLHIRWNKYNFASVHVFQFQNKAAGL